MINATAGYPLLIYNAAVHMALRVPHASAMLTAADRADRPGEESTLCYSEQRTRLDDRLPTARKFLTDDYPVTCQHRHCCSNLP